MAMNYESILQEIELSIEWNERTKLIKNRIVDILNSYAEKEKWISVKNHNPEPFEDILIQTTEDSVYVGWWDDKDNEFKATDFSFGKLESDGGYGIAYMWRKLPEIYKN